MRRLPPPDHMRCIAIAGKGVWSNPDGRCIRRKSIGDMCAQHAKIFARRNKPAGQAVAK